MKDRMEYNGYFGSVAHDEKKKMYYGKVESTDFDITYEGKDLEALREAFEEAVDAFFDMDDLEED